MTPIFQILSPDARGRIAGAAMQILERTGVRLTHASARLLLAEAGATEAGDRVRLPPRLVEIALKSAPKRITIYDRTGAPAMHLGGQACYFGAHTDAPELLDPQTGRRRPCLEADVAAHARLIDALPNLAFTTASGLVADRPAQIADRVALAQCLTNSTKPVLAMPVTRAGLTGCHQLAALATGGEAALRARPLLIVYAEPVSPLVLPDDAVDRLLYCAGHEIPLVFSGYAAMGATAPLSPAAITAQLCAESLSGLAIHQLKRPGAPYIFGGMASVMDMRTTVFSYGAAEFQRGNALMAEMARHFDLPNFGTAGTSDAQCMDGQALVEATSSCLLAELTRANLVHDVGLLGNATVVMPGMIVATDELIALVRRMLAGVGAGADDLALEVLEAVGPGGEFVTHDHTLANFRQVWYPRLLYRGGAKAWRAEMPDYQARANERARKVMAQHWPEPLPEAAQAGLTALLRRAEAAIEYDPLARR